ncbi:MAG: HEAT repeat domain-containing protein [Brevinematales bacterium]|jgi:HEAT repeat protein
MKKSPVILLALSFIFSGGLIYGAHNITEDAVDTVGPDGIPQLIDVIRSTDPNDDDIRIKAMKRLGELKAKEATDMLIEMLQTRRLVMGGKEIYNWKLQVEAARALGAIGDDRASIYLVEMLRYENDNTVKRAAAQALGDMGEAARKKPVLDVMYSQLEAAKDQGLASDLCEALGKIGDKSAFVYLLRVTQGPWLNYVKETAQKSIAMTKWDKVSVYEDENATNSGAGKTSTATATVKNDTNSHK